MLKIGLLKKQRLNKIYSGRYRKQSIDLVINVQIYNNKTNNTVLND